MASKAHPPAPAPLHVMTHDTAGRFLVTSEGDLCKRYCVDVLAFEGEGECDCDNWNFRIGPHRRAEPPTVPPIRFCKHIVAAREFFTDQVIQRMLAMQKGTA